jgi:hypothetical protein
MHIQHNLIKKINQFNKRECLEFCPNTSLFLNLVQFRFKNEKKIVQTGLRKQFEDLKICK